MEPADEPQDRRRQVMGQRAREFLQRPRGGGNRGQDNSALRAELHATVDQVFDALGPRTFEPSQLLERLQTAMRGVIRANSIGQELVVRDENDASVDGVMERIRQLVQSALAGSTPGTKAGTTGLIQAAPMLVSSLAPILVDAIRDPRKAAAIESQLAKLLTKYMKPTQARTVAQMTVKAAQGLAERYDSRGGNTGAKGR